MGLECEPQAKGRGRPKYKHLLVKNSAKKKGKQSHKNANGTTSSSSGNDMSDGLAQNDPTSEPWEYNELGGDEDDDHDDDDFYQTVLGSSSPSLGKRYSSREEKSYKKRCGANHESSPSTKDNPSYPDQWLLGDLNPDTLPRQCLDNPFIPEMYYRSACLLMLSEFSRLLRSNGLDQLKVLCTMKSRAMRILRFGQEEYFKMVLDMQASLMGLKNWQQIVSPEEKTYAENSRGSSIHTDEFMRAKVDIEAIIQPFADNTLPQSYSVSIHGEPVTYCNDRYCELFLEDASELEAFNAQKLYAPLLWGKSLCPEDHSAFFATVVQASCGAGSQASKCSRVANCLRKDGTTFPGLIRIQSFFAPSGMGYSYSVVEMPSSSTTNDDGDDDAMVEDSVPASSSGQGDDDDQEDEESGPASSSSPFFNPPHFATLLLQQPPAGTKKPS